MRSPYVGEDAVTDQSELGPASGQSQAGAGVTLSGHIERINPKDIAGVLKECGAVVVQLHDSKQSRWDG